MANLIDLRMPDEQQEGTQSMVGRWLIKIGEPVEKNQAVLEISTDKVSIEVVSPCAGVLHQIVKEEGQDVAPGDLLGLIALEGESPLKGAEELECRVSARAVPSPRSDRSSSDPTELRLSPSVKRLVAEHNLDISKISGSGQNGRISYHDVLNYLSNQEKSSSENRASEVNLQKHSAMRRSIAQRMQSSMQTAPHVTSVFEVNLSQILTDRASKKSQFESKGARLTLTAYFVRAAVLALRQVPEANSKWHTDGLEFWNDYNIGIATALEAGSDQEQGLIVPVLMRAQELSLFEIAVKLEDLTSRARNNKLEPSEVRNGTFTISNHGVSGSLIATPIIINQPQSAILGIGKLEKRTRVVEENGVDVVKIYPMAYVSLTIDHRVLDGQRANQFLSVFVSALENWQNDPQS